MTAAWRNVLSNSKLLYLDLCTLVGVRCCLEIELNFMFHRLWQFSLAPFSDGIFKICFYFVHNSFCYSILIKLSPICSLDFLYWTLLCPHESWFGMSSSQNVTYSIAAISIIAERLLLPSTVRRTHGMWTGFVELLQVRFETEWHHSIWMWKTISRFISNEIDKNKTMERKATLTTANANGSI